MKLERGMVVTVDLNPTKGSETGKIRPCVIVTNDIYNQKLPVIQVVPITEWNEKKGRILTNVTLSQLKKMDYLRNLLQIAFRLGLLIISNAWLG
jgi:mRNA-degrading endonuclease toxin of MazEF toxin-antitoxin module